MNNKQLIKEIHAIPFLYYKNIEANSLNQSKNKAMKHLKTISLKDVILITGLALLLFFAYKVLTDPNLSNFMHI